MFKGICNNWLFFFIEILTIVVQVLLVQFSGYAVKCTPLNWWEYSICIGIGMFGLVIGLLVKLLPIKLFSVKMKEEPLTFQEMEKSLSTRLRKSSTLLSFKTRHSFKDLDAN